MSKIPFVVDARILHNKMVVSHPASCLFNDCTSFVLFNVYLYWFRFPQTVYLITELLCVLFLIFFSFSFHSRSMLLVILEMGDMWKDWKGCWGGRHICFYFYFKNIFTFIFMFIHWMLKPWKLTFKKYAWEDLILQVQREGILIVWCGIT